MTIRRDEIVGEGGQWASASTEPPCHLTPREELTGPHRAVSDVLDDYLMREHGKVTSHNGWDLFLQLLAEQGYEVVHRSPGYWS